MKLLVNGCSFIANGYEFRNLGRELGCNEFVNLAKGGSSNRRIVRTTIEYIEKNPVDFVLLGLTFWDRQEGAFLQTQYNTDNWVSYNAHGMQGLFAPDNAQFVFDNSRTIIEKYIQDRYRYEINLQYIDQILLDVIMLHSYLKVRNIRHVFFNSCEIEYPTYFDNINGLYRNSINQIKNIISLESFVMNLYLYQLGAKYAPNESRWEPHCIHYDGAEYRHINEYLLKYIQDNNL